MEFQEIRSQREEFCFAAVWRKISHGVVKASFGHMDESVRLVSLQRTAILF